MPYRLELLFITWLTCCSIAPDAIAAVSISSNLVESHSTVLEPTVADNPAAAPSPAPSAPAVELSASPAPSSPSASQMEWVWWGAMGLAPVGVIAGIFYSLRPRKQQLQRKQTQVPDSHKPEPGLPSPSLTANTAKPDLDYCQSSRPNENDRHSATGSALQPTSGAQPIEPNPDAIVLAATTRLAKVDIVETLIQDLRSTDPHKRRSAIWELGQRGDSRAIQPLVDLLIDADSKQRGLILAAISEIGTRTLKPMNRALLVSLQDDSPEVRKNAIRDVTRIFEWMTQVSQVLQYATSDADTEVRETAEWAMGQLNRVRPPTPNTKPEEKVLRAE